MKKNFDGNGLETVLQKPFPCGHVKNQKKQGLQNKNSDYKEIAKKGLETVWKLSE